MTEGKIKTGLDLLREPFPSNQISKLPKPTRRQTDAVKNDFTVGVRCPECGGWHHPKVVHIDYVGHAALTDRLLDCDPLWNWEPLAHTEYKTPHIDQNGGMWIKLTVCGVTRFGYGHADGKTGGDAVKEIIGDALRNAAMRFGAALDLWHKGQLHANFSEEIPQEHQGLGEEPINQAKDYLAGADNLGDLKERWESIPKNVTANADVIAAKDAAKNRLSALVSNDPLLSDEIPY